MYTLYAESFHTSKVQDLTHILNYIISVGSAKNMFYHSINALVKTAGESE
jgi:hypothetical protein